MNPMNILVIGSGGREHAICWKLKKSEFCKQLYCSPGNAGIGQIAQRTNLKTHAEIIEFCKKNNIEFVVIGPEQPLVDGLADDLKASGINVFGCSKAAAQLEASKDFTKKLCVKYNIPTASYQAFEHLENALEYVKNIEYPHVIKADGLAAGKGVVIAENQQQAEEAVKSMFSGRFGEAGKKVVIEEFLQGQELSFFALSDGNTALEFASAQDHKRAFDGDKGPNTGGMGTYSPASIATSALGAQVLREIILPTVEAMKTEKIPFEGVLFAGLMLTKQGPKLLEYNTRFGDPETQVMLLRLKSDLLELLYACATKNLAKIKIELFDEAAVCVVMAAKGYPEHYEKGSEIKGLQFVEASGALAFHAGTEEKHGKITASGGRVLNICATGVDVKQARNKAYAAVSKIDWPDGFYRKDIAERV